MLTRVALAATIAAILVGLYFNGFFELLTDPDRVRAVLEDLGIWAPILYVVAFATLEPFFIPGIAFMVPGSFVFSFAELFVLSWLGAIGAGIVGFSFARFMGREFVESRLPDRLRVYDERLATHGLRTVILVRFMLFLMPPAHWLLGVSQVRFSSFVLGTAIGFIPGIAGMSYLIVFLGDSFGEWMDDRPPGFFAVIIIGLVIANRTRKWIVKKRELAKQAASSNRGSDQGNDQASEDGSSQPRSEVGVSDL